MLLQCAGLDPRFDITEIAAPYARGLLLEGSPQVTKARKEFKKGLDKQVQTTPTPVFLDQK